MRLTRRRKLWWLRAVVLVEAVVLLLSGLANVVVDSGEPAFEPLFPIAIAVVLVIAFADLHRELRRPAWWSVAPRRPTALVSLVVAQAASIPLLLVPLWTEWHSGRHDLLDLAICAVSFVALLIALCITVAALAARPEATINKGWVALLALLPLVSLVQFWYATFYRPAHQRPNVNIVARLDRIGTSAGKSRMRATIILDNNGPTDLNVFDAVYTVTGFKVSPDTGPLTRPQLSAALGGSLVAAGDRAGGYAGLLRVGRLIRPGGHLAQGQKQLTSVVFDVRNDVADKLRLTVQLSTVVNNGQDLSPFTACSSGLAHPSTCEQTSIPTQGWLGSVLSDGPVARVVFDDPPGFPPSLQTTFGYAATAGSPSDFHVSQQVRDLYPYLNSRGFTTSVEYASAP